MADDSMFVARKLEVMPAYCARCPEDNRALAIAWVWVTVQKDPGTSITFPVCREHGLDVQKEAAAAGNHVDLREI